MSDHNALVQALSRLAGNRQSDGTSSLVSAADRTAIIDGCHDLIAASKASPSSNLGGAEVTHEDICSTNEGGPCNCDWSAAYHTTIPNLGRSERLPYDLRLQIGKALDRLVCDESTPEQVDQFIATFLEFGLNITGADPVEAVQTTLNIINVPVLEGDIATAYQYAAEVISAVDGSTDADCLLEAQYIIARAMTDCASVGWLYDNEDTGREFSENHPVESGEVPDATNIVPATAGALLSDLKLSWANPTPATTAIGGENG